MSHLLLVHTEEAVTDPHGAAERERRGRAQSNRLRR